MVLDSFLNVVDTEWNLVFSDIKGESVGYALPTVQIPKEREDFITCRLNVYPDDFIWGVATASY